MSEVQNKGDIAQETKNLAVKQESKTRVPVATKSGDIPKPSARIKAKPQKKTFGTKLKEAFFGDNIGDGSISEHVLFKICIPAVKRVVSEMANSAINMALGLDPKTRTIDAGRTTHTANSTVYRDRNLSRSSDDRIYYSARRNSISEWLWTLDDAEDILDEIFKALDEYHMVTVSDVYSIMNLGDQIKSTDKNYGWTSPRGMSIVEVHDGQFALRLPPAGPI